MAQLGKKSLQNLSGVDKRLVRLITEAIKDTPVDFSVVEGLRTLDRQRELYNEGKSKTMNSKHLRGLAVDICPYVNGRLEWNNKGIWKRLIDHIKAKSRLLGIPCTFGFDWGWDSPHIEIK